MLFNLSLTWIIIAIYILNAVVMLFYRAWYRKKKPAEQHGAAEWIVMMSLALPIIGWVVPQLLYTLARRKASNGLFDDYKEYINYTVTNLEAIRTEARIAANMSPLQDMLSNPSLDIRKQAILRFVSQDVTDKGKYLRTGLTSGDSEIIHYAAAAMNNVTSQFEKEKTHILKQDIHEEERMNLLSDHYERYISTGVLAGPQKRRVLLEWLPVLKQLIEKQPSQTTLKVKLAELFEMLEQQEEAEQTYLAAIDQAPTKSELYMPLLRYYYSQNKWIKLESLLEKMKQRVDRRQLTDQQIHLLSILEGTNAMWRETS